MDCVTKKSHCYAGEERNIDHVNDLKSIVYSTGLNIHYDRHQLISCQGFYLLTSD